MAPPHLRGAPALHRSTSPVFRALLAAVALSETLSHYAPIAALSLKWPNDVPCGGTKLGGILIDSALLLQSDRRVRAFPTGEILQAEG